MYLVIGYSQRARASIRNAAQNHPESVVRRFGRVVLVADSEFGAFLACRFRAEFGADVQVERLEPFVPEQDVPDRVRVAARQYADRSSKSTSYTAFAAGTDHPDPASLKEGE